MANLLNLDTLTEVSTVTVDGVAYPLKSPGRLSLLDNHLVAKWGARVQELHRDVETLTDEAVTELGELLDRLCRLILLAPPEIHDRLGDDQRLAVVTVFIGLQRNAATTAGVKADTVATEPVETSTGEST